MMMSDFIHRDSLAIRTLMKQFLLLMHAGTIYLKTMDPMVEHLLLHVGVQMCSELSACINRIFI